MQTKYFYITTLLFVGTFIFSTDGFSQYDWPSLSPKGEVTQVVGNTTISVEYERPSARHRKIFGQLVPWDKVWRTGAAYCTKVMFDRNVIVGGQHVPAGKYSLFTIPNKEEWMIILNKDTTLYGSYNYESSRDAARFVVRPRQTERFYEALTIDIDIIPNNGRMYISWEQTQVFFDIITSTDMDVTHYITSQLRTDEVTDSDEYSMAADYLYYQNGDYYKALELADKSIAIEDSGWNRNIKTSIYEKLHLYDKAIVEIQKGIELEKRRHYDNEKYRQRELSVWNDKLKRMKLLLEK